MGNRLICSAWYVQSNLGLVRREDMARDAIQYEGVRGLVISKQSPQSRARVRLG